MTNETKENETRTAVGGLVDPIVMTEQDHLIASLSEHVQANAECLERLILLTAEALPHTQEAASHLMAEWHRINAEINTELKQELANIKES